jgi:hypothetical protein
MRSINALLPSGYSLTQSTQPKREQKPPLPIVAKELFDLESPILDTKKCKKTSKSLSKGFFDIA